MDSPQGLPIGLQIIESFWGSGSLCGRTAFEQAHEYHQATAKLRNHGIRRRHRFRNSRQLNAHENVYCSTLRLRSRTQHYDPVLVFGTLLVLNYEELVALDLAHAN